MADIVKFQQQLLSDPAARKAFAANPQAYLDQHGVTAPAQLQLPASLPLDQLEENVREVVAHMKDEHLDAAALDRTSTAELARFIGDAFPVKTKDLPGIVGMRENFRTPGDMATVSVVGVVVVVAVVKVAVAGSPADLSRLGRPELGIAGVTRGRVGITVHGPAGLRVEGLTADELTTVIRLLR